nr:hypothetical protein [Tanacetum cinerariifolium]
MLEESDYESWKIRIERYINGKTHGKLIWKSILNGPSTHSQITDPVPTGSPVGQTLDQRKEDLFDEYERFRANEHALKKLKKQEQSSSVVDPLAYLVKTTHQQAPTHSTTTSQLQLRPALTSTSSSTAQSHDDAMLATMKQITNLLRGNTRNTGYRGNQNNGKGVNNKKKVIYYCHREGHVARQCKEPKCPKDSLWQQDKAMLLQAKENGAVLDAEAEAFLAKVECTVLLAEPFALTTTNIFQVNHEDAYDSDVDDVPNAAAALMANLSSSSSQINEDEHLDFDDDSVHEDYTIPYDQYVATKESQDVPTEAYLIPPTTAYMLQTLTDLTTQVEGHRKVNQEQALINATLSAELDQ